MRLALAFAALLLPGLAWWLWFGDRRKDGAQALAEIIAISASFIALGTLGFYTVRLKFTPLLLGIVLGVCFGVAFAGLIRRGKGAFNKTWLFALLGLAVALVWRFWQARDLLLPNWVDSQHHVLIIRKMIEFGGLPSTLEPYLPGPFYYHFGFHAVGALFSVLSGLDPAASVLMLGQVINACVGLAVYALAKQLSKDWRIGLLAALFVTFATKMPGYYLTWGRYTLLIGVMILPVAIAEAIHAWENHDKWWKLSGLSLLTAGTLLSHYFTAFLLAIYLVVFGIDWIVGAFIKKKAELQAFLTLFTPVFLGLLFSARWYIRVIRYSADFINKTFRLSSRKIILDQSQLDYLRYILGPTPAYFLVLLTIVGLVLGLFRPKWRPFAIWSFMLILFTLPLGFEILSFRSDHFGLILFLIISLMSAICLIWLYDQLSQKLRMGKLIQIFFFVIILVFVCWGAYTNMDAINDSTLLIAEDDIAALDWIDTHTPMDARFFVNTTSWGYGLYRSRDGGGWILPNTGRWSLSPTIFYAYGGDQSVSATWTDWSKRASNITTCGKDFWELVEEADLDYVYIRKGTGGLQSEELINCGGLISIYQGELVSIWLIERP
ncbi:MAG TPA: hypothetical protein PLH64_04785 [Anaerolineaceae bacterium]|nr:hypothetical protein [Anaerolineaceae bacterium]